MLISNNAQDDLLQTPGVAIILLNYRGASDTVACINALKQLTYPQFRIIVVDNDSQDQSVETLSKAFPEIELIQAPQNLGFSGGNNLGIQRALTDPNIQYVWILNNDTLPEPEALTALVAETQKQPSALVGSLILNMDGGFQSIGTYVTRPLASIQTYPEKKATNAQLVESLSGCSMLIPRQAFETVGLWDERYFLYFEDNDFCLKAAQAGFKSLVATQSRVFHQKNASTGKNRPLITYYYQRNRLLLASQHFSKTELKIAEAYTRFRLWRSGQKLKRKKSEEARQHHQAFEWAITDYFKGQFGKCPHPL